MERALAPFGDPGAVRGSGGARQEASEATCSRHTLDSIGRRGSRSGKPGTLRGESGNGLSQERGTNRALARSWGAACGEPAPPWKAVCHPLREGVEAKAQSAKRRSERREPDVREPGDLAGADDNKLVAEIGERHLAAGRARSRKTSSDVGGRRVLSAASWSGWPVKRDELGLRGE